MVVFAPCGLLNASALAYERLFFHKVCRVYPSCWDKCRGHPHL